MGLSVLLLAHVNMTCILRQIRIKSRALKVMAVLSDRVAKALPLETDFNLFYLAPFYWLVRSSKCLIIRDSMNNPDTFGFIILGRGWL